MGKFNDLANELQQFIEISEEDFLTSDDESKLKKLQEDIRALDHISEEAKPSALKIMEDHYALFNERAKRMAETVDIHANHSSNTLLVALLKDAGVGKYIAERWKPVVDVLKKVKQELSISSATGSAPNWDRSSSTAPQAEAPHVNSNANVVSSSAKVTN